MATVKEIKLKKNGAMVSPVVLIDSLKNLDGTKYKDTVTSALNGKANSSHTHDDRYYTESEIESKVSTLNTAINGKANSSHNHVVFKNITSGYDYEGEFDEYPSHYHEYSLTLPTLNKGEIAICNIMIPFDASNFEIDCALFIKSPSDGTYIITDLGNTIMETKESTNVHSVDVDAGEDGYWRWSCIMAKTT